MESVRGKSPERSEKKNVSEEQGVVREVLQRALSLGLSSLFSTQETVRKAMGEAMPPEWIDFASEQSNRARQEFIDRLSAQIEGVIQRIDVKELVESVMQGRTVEVKASIKILPPKEAAGRKRNPEATSYEISVTPKKTKAPGSIAKKP